MVDPSLVAADEPLVYHLEAELDEEKRTPALGWRNSVDTSIGTSFRMGGNPPEPKRRIVLFAVNILKGLNHCYYPQLTQHPDCEQEEEKKRALASGSLTGSLVY